MIGSRLLPVLLGAFLFLFFPSYVVQWIGLGLVLVVVLSLGYSRAVSAGLFVERVDAEVKAYQLQTVPIRIRITNRSILPVPALVVTDNPGSLYSGDENNRLVSLKPGERTELVYHIKGMNRGLYRIGPLSLRFSDPLGFFPVVRRIEKESRFIVYPRIHPIDLPVHHGLPSGAITVANRIYEDPTRFRSIREYVAGDELRRVNWKASARLGALYSTEWLPTINVPVMVLMNLSAPAFEQRNRYAHTERTIDAAASLVHHLAERRQAAGLVTTGVLGDPAAQVMPAIPVGTGARHAVSILETLAQLQANPQPADPVERFLEHASVSFGTRLFYLGPALAAESLAALLAAVRDRSRIRLCYIEEGVLSPEPATGESVRLYRITEYGDEVFTLQA